MANCASILNATLEPIPSYRASRVTARNTGLQGASRRTVLVVRASGATPQARISDVTPWGPGAFGPWLCCGSRM